MHPSDAFDQGLDEDAARAEDVQPLVVDLDGFEGPLDILLVLARGQKVDLARISILQLAEQYLAFIEQIRGIKLEVAADYLVMAAWLAYLKSRLLLPLVMHGEASFLTRSSRLKPVTLIGRLGFSPVWLALH